MALQLDLFTGREISPSFEGAHDYDAAAKRAGIDGLFLNPCKGCALRDFCGSDDCAQHGFDLDVDDEPKGDWYDFLMA